MKANHRKRNLSSTKYIALNTRSCDACWKCIAICKNKVLRQINVLFHKHAKIKNAEACTGCLKCIKVCECKAITSLIQKKTDKQ